MKEKAKYIHLFEELKRRILQGEYQNGQRLPGENEMAGEFAMSRQTVRQALSLLEQEGFIQRRQGSGTYVRRVERRRERSWNVGVVATYISEYIFPSILRGIEGELSEEGFFPALCHQEPGGQRAAHFGGLHGKAGGRPDCGGHQKRPAQPQSALV